MTFTLVSLLGPVPGLGGTQMDPPALAAPGELFLVPDDMDLSALSVHEIHNYGPARLVSLAAAKAMPAELMSQLLPIQDSSAVSYRAWQGAPSGARLGAEGDGYYIVSLVGPVDMGWVGQLERSGLKAVDVAQPYALVVHAPDGRIRRALRLKTTAGYDAVLGITPVPVEARIDPELLSVAEGRKALSELPGARLAPDGRAVVRVIPYADQQLEEIVAAVSRYAERADERLAYGNPDAFLVSGAEARTIVDAVPGVAYLELQYERVRLNNIAAQGSILNVEPVWNLGYTGTGISVNHNDSGVDLNHPDFPAGVITATTGPMSSAANPITDNGHGTHTAGSVVGRGLAAASPANTSGCGDVTPPLGTVRGMAPGATLTTNNIFEGTNETEDEMMRWGYQQGSRISTNSWGFPTLTSYSSQAVTVDRAVRDADTTASGNQELSILFAAGNSGPNLGTINSPATAKNVITVGNSLNNRCGSRVPSAQPGPDINVMRTTSSRGPSQGRIKPDIVAVGTDVLSTQSSDPGASHPLDQTWTGNWYELDTGTSMACPITAGAEACFFQYYRGKYGVLPSPALAKAALINGAVDMGFGYPSFDQGWGRLNLLRSIKGPSGGEISFVDQREVTPLATGASWSRVFTVASTSVPLKITLVWTDEPGTANTAVALVNDLDLVVTAPNGTVYRGNKFTSSWSAPNALVADRANNVENVFVQSPAVGNWTIRVSSANTARNVPGLNGQDFAIAYSGTLGSYAAGSVSQRVVSGDFDRDGREDDIATFYDYGNNNTRIHVWLSTGNSFVYQGNSGWWQGGANVYTAGALTGRIVSGDFDRDGYKDDIAGFYDYGSNNTRIHVWLSTGSSFAYQGDLGWWQGGANSYTAGALTGRVVSGDFDRDGYKDDIAGFYDYGSYNTRIHVWLSTGSSFVYQGDQGWWYGGLNGYAAGSISQRVVSGDFDRDGTEDDIAAFYDLGSSNTRINVWLSTGSSFTYQSNWWQGGAGTYTAGALTGRIVSGDFDRDGWKDDIAGFYDYGSSNTRTHVWRSTGTSLAYQGDLGWWQGGANSYTAGLLAGRVVSGDFDRDTYKDDIAGFYDYGNYSTRIHVWTSTAASLAYAGDAGWWSTSP